MGIHLWLAIQIKKNIYLVYKYNLLNILLVTTNAQSVHFYFGHFQD